MESYDLARQGDRLAVAELIFTISAHATSAKARAARLFRL